VLPAQPLEDLEDHRRNVLAPERTDRALGSAPDTYRHYARTDRLRLTAQDRSALSVGGCWMGSTIFGTGTGRVWRVVGVSEYQHYEFLAVDAPLDAKAQAAVRALSTRAQITPTGFVNTYQWGDFKGDPQALVERYYDAFLYTANWGTHQFMLRLPAKVLDPALVHRYCCTPSADSWTTKRHVVIDLTFSADERGDEWWQDWDEEQDTLGDGWLTSLIPARADLAAGDHRLLYLAWLHAVSGDEHDDGITEPPVPAGLGTLPASLRRLADFLRIDTDLLTAAAQASPALTPTGPSRTAWRAALATLPVREKDALLLRVLDGDPHVGAELPRLLTPPPDDPAPQPRRTIGDLRATASGLRTEREQQEAKAEAARTAARDRAATQARTWLALAEA
jgi:hypothetical protein